jgi:penicillin G amidase
VNPVRVSWPRIRTILIWVVAVLLALILVLTLVVVWTVRRSFPEYDGELRLAGLSAPVVVHRDDHGIPQLYAKTADDLFRAQGYLHAQDRFWEMDFRRHVTGGRLAELFGESQVETDRYLRTMGWRRVAEQELAVLAPDTRRYLQAYADGVNAWLADHDGATASLEYAVLGLQNSDYTIERWNPVDSLAWLKAMAWDLRGNMDAEITRAALLASGLTRQQVEELYPAYPYDRNAPIIGGGAVVAGAFSHSASAGGPAAGAPPPAAGGSGGGATAQTLRAIGDGLARLPVMIGNGGPGIGSNSWVISGRLTDTGKPILANDPHLGPTMPGIWYQMGLHCECEYDAAGFTFSGVPGVVIGHNTRIAWGFTNLDPDVSDLYLERVDGDRVQVDGAWQPLETRSETLKVAGGSDVRFTVRSSRHGPLLSDASVALGDIGVKPPVDPAGSPAATAAAPLGSRVAPAGSANEAVRDGYAVALAWTALRPGRTADALFTLNRARNWTEFRAAAALFEVPAQNLIYADVDGNVGYQAPGRVPVRKKGDGRWMAPGWDSAYDWSGFVPFAELPTAYNPAEGYVVTANQAVIGPQYQRFLTRDWSYGYRSQRIRELISSARVSGPIGLDDVQAMQFDNRNGFAPTLVPAVRAALESGDPSDAAVTAAADLWPEWDFQQPADGEGGTAAGRSSAAAAYFNATWRHLLLLTFDELPTDHRADGNDRWFEVVRGLLTRPDAAWWDRKDTDPVERRDDILRRAAADAVAELRRDQGDDPADWRWGRMHVLTVRNQTFGTSGIGPIEWLFNLDPAGVSGGDSIVNATGWTAPAGYEVDAVPSMRMIVDLSNLDRSRWIQLTGNSGHAFHRHYADQFELWRTGGTLPMRWDRSAIEEQATDTLTFRP